MLGDRIRMISAALWAIMRLQYKKETRSKHNIYDEGNEMRKDNGHESWSLPYDP